jgi:hypothetical protein
MLQRVLFLIAVALVLASCSTTKATSCIPLTEYTQGFSEALAGEVERAAPGAVWPDAIANYLTLRAQIKAAGAAC